MPGQPDRAFATWNPPAPQTATLSSGLQVIFMRMPGAVAIGASFGIDTGSADEPDEWAGISHFLEHLVFRGTDAYASSEAIGLAIEAVGGDFNAFTGKSSTQYICAAPLEHTDLVIRIPAELVARPLFRQKDIEDERPVVLREIGLEEDSAGRRMTRALESIIWPGSPMARPIIGRQDALQALTAKDIRAYWNTHYLPANATFALAGDLPFEQALELIDRATAQWKPARTTARRPSAPVQDVDGRVAVQNMPARQETVLALASAVGPWKSLNVPAISVLATLAGDGEGSLITRDLVRRRGVLVSGGSLAWLNRDAGAIGFTGTVRPSGLARGVTSLLKLAEQLKKSPSQSDFQRATGFVRGDILRQWLRPLDVAVQLCQQALLGDSEIGPLHDLEALAKVTPQHLTELAETLFERDALRIAAAGPVDSNGDLSRLFAARIG